MKYFHFLYPEILYLVSPGMILVYDCVLALLTMSLFTPPVCVINCMVSESKAVMAFEVGSSSWKPHHLSLACFLIS